MTPLGSARVLLIRDYFRLIDNDRQHLNHAGIPFTWSKSGQPRKDLLPQTLQEITAGVSAKLKLVATKQVSGDKLLTLFRFIRWRT